MSFSHGKCFFLSNANERCICLEICLLPDSCQLFYGWGWLTLCQCYLKMHAMGEGPSATLSVLRCFFYLWSAACSVQFSSSVVSDSFWPQALQHTRPPCPSPSPGVHSNTRQSSHDAIQPSYPLSSPSFPAPNPSQHQSLFQWVNSANRFIMPYYKLARGYSFCPLLMSMSEAL